MMLLTSPNGPVVDMQLALTLLQEQWRHNAQSCLYTERERQAITTVILPGLEEIQQRRISLDQFWRWIEALRLPTLLAIDARAIPEEVGLRLCAVIEQLRRDMVLLSHYHLRRAQAQRTDRHTRP